MRRARYRLGEVATDGIAALAHQGGSVPDVSCQRIGAPLPYEWLLQESGCCAATRLA